MDSFALTEGMLPEQNQRNVPDSSGNLPEGAQKFQRAISAWRGIFDLPESSILL